MPGHNRRRHPFFSYLTINNRRTTPKEIQEELTLRLSREDLFDRCVLLPHAEINVSIYNAVNQFVSRYNGSSLKICILGCSINESTQDTFREVYRAHYDDEYEKVAHYLHQRYRRIIALLIVSAVSFYTSLFVFNNIESMEFIKEIVSEIEIFCLWEIGYTHFDRAEAIKEMKKTIRARDAEILFE